MLFPLDYQAKATWEWSAEDEDIVYDMEAKAWNKLARREEGSTPIILILMCLPKEENCWVDISEDRMLLEKCSYWYRVPSMTTRKGVRVNY